MRPLHLYLLGTGSWFLAFGLQSVMFAWLVTIVLHESPEKVGVAQMMLLLPGTLLVLFAGSYADRLGGKRVAVGAQLIAMLAPVLLLIVLIQGSLSFAVMLGYAVLMGSAQAFVTPARDGLLNQVAGGRVQRTVMLTSLVQFTMQICGYLIASTADVLGAAPIVALQAGVLLVGVIAYALLRPPVNSNPPKPIPLFRSIAEGARTVWTTPAIRMVMFQNMAMGAFFMGSFIVTVPLLIRDVFDGTARDLGVVYAVNSMGLILVVMVLLRLGDVHRQGRALMLAHAVGSVALAGASFASELWVFMLALFCWGGTGGVAVTMSRTIVQETAPVGQLGRAMSFYTFTFFGAGPFGALLNGYLVEFLGPRTTLLTSACVMVGVLLLFSVFSRFWSLDSRKRAMEP